MPVLSSQSCIMRRCPYRSHAPISPYALIVASLMTRHWREHVFTRAVHDCVKVTWADYGPYDRTTQASHFYRNPRWLIPPSLQQASKSRSRRINIQAIWKPSGRKQTWGRDFQKWLIIRRLGLGIWAKRQTRTWEAPHDARTQVDSQQRARKKKTQVLSNILQPGQRDGRTQLQVHWNFAVANRKLRFGDLT